MKTQHTNALPLALMNEEQRPRLTLQGSKQQLVVFSLTFLTEASEIICNPHRFRLRNVGKVYV